MFNGFSFGVGGRALKKTAAFDPSSLSLTGWWRASYTGSPWVGTASAGSSGSHDLSEATNPPSTGSAQNGFTPADFDGTNDQLANANAISTFISASAWFIWSVFWVDAINTNGVNNWFNDSIINDSSSFWGLYLANAPSNKIIVHQWDTAPKSNEHTISTGTYNLICARYDGTNLRSKLNSGSILSTASGNISDISGTVKVGRDAAGLSLMDGRILEIGIINSAESDSRFDDIISYVNNYYALSL